MLKNFDIKINVIFKMLFICLLLISNCETIKNNDNLIINFFILDVITQNQLQFQNLLK